MRRTALTLCLTALASTAAWADKPTFTLIAENGRFTPEVVEVPANTRFRLEITNKNAGPEEFESLELRKETVLAPGVTRSIVFAPLKPGRYPFFGEFHPDTAKGEIVAK
ncbi:MAG: cupredoxin domain-containing protein [Proteobacteria bacterium]|nr:MAG: cupredoxin domain-containing protein [Pseudomonadota bacterium]